MNSVDCHPVLRGYCGAGEEDRHQHTIINFGDRIVRQWSSDEAPESSWDSQLRTRRINLRRPDLPAAKGALDQIQITGFVVQVGRERVSEGVDRALALDAHPLEIF